MTPEERKDFAADIAAAIKAEPTLHALSEDEQRWVRLAIQKEAQAIDMRRAIIEKTLSALIWSAFLGLGTLLLSWARGGFKP